jgi:putative membrane protein insertion efficiency factor
MNPPQLLLVLCVRAYQRCVSPVLSAVFGPLGMGCRFHPTCSQYALEALRLHGACRGAWLTLKRLARCHPWGGHGDDPVPPLPGATPKPPRHRNRFDLSNA